MNERKSCGRPEITPATTVVGGQANVREASLLVVHMMEYRLKYIEWLEKEVQKETELLHMEREPKKFISSYNRVMKMVKTISELISEDRFDAFHLQLIIRMRKAQTLGSEVFERPEPLSYIH